jgi:hypothetical protein
MMYVSANEKAVSLNLHRYREGAPESYVYEQPWQELEYKVAHMRNRAGLAAELVS